MRTNDLKKGTRVILDHGVKAILNDNKSGTVRQMVVTVGEFSEAGPSTETCDEYTHKITAYQGKLGQWFYDIEYTPEQERARQMSALTG